MPQPEKLNNSNEVNEPKLKPTAPVPLEEIDMDLVKKAREIQASGQRLDEDSDEATMLIRFLRTTGSLSGKSYRRYKYPDSREDFDHEAA